MWLCSNLQYIKFTISILSLNAIKVYCKQFHSKLSVLLILYYKQITNFFDCARAWNQTIDVIHFATVKLHMVWQYDILVSAILNWKANDKLANIQIMSWLQYKSFARDRQSKCMRFWSTLKRLHILAWNII